MEIIKAKVVLNMSKQRRNFSSKFKSDLVIELLKGEKDLNTLATENSIQPNLLRNWKKEFLDKASVVFDDSREDNLKEKLAVERKEKTAYAKKVGQLTMQVDWLKKNLKKYWDLTTRVSLVRNLSKTKELPVAIGAELLDINRTSFYYGGIRPYLKLNWPVRKLLTGYILIIQPGEPDRFLLSLKPNVIRLAARK